MTIGEIIKEYRHEHGLSQRQFAEMCGDVTNGYISMIEQGKNPSTGKPIIPSIDKLTMFAHGMGISLHQLIEMADDMPVYVGEDVSEKLNDIGESMTSFFPKYDETRIVSAGMDKLPKEQRERVLAVVRAMFANDPSLFDKKG